MQRWLKKANIEQQKDLKMFGWDDFGEDRKREKKWLGKEEREKIGGPKYFLLELTKTQSPQINEKIEKNKYLHSNGWTISSLTVGPSCYCCCYCYFLRLDLVVVVVVVVVVVFFFF